MPKKIEMREKIPLIGAEEKVKDFEQCGQFKIVDNFFSKLSSTL